MAVLTAMVMFGWLVGWLVAGCLTLYVLVLQLIDYVPNTELQSLFINGLHEQQSTLESHQVPFAGITTNQPLVGGTSHSVHIPILGETAMGHKRNISQSGHVNVDKRTHQCDRCSAHGLRRCPFRTINGFHCYMNFLEVGSEFSL